MDELFPEPPSKPPLRDTVNELKVLQILTLVINEGKTVGEACQEVGVPTSTWQFWQKSGVTMAAYAELRNRIAELTFEILLPGYPQMVQTLAYIAQGISPPHAPRMKVEAGQAIAAWREIMKLIPIGAMDQVGAGSIASAHLRDYQPKQLNPIPHGPTNVNLTQINQFLYTAPLQEDILPPADITGLTITLDDPLDEEPTE